MLVFEWILVSKSDRWLIRFGSLLAPVWAPFWTPFWHLGGSGDHLGPTVTLNDVPRPYRRLKIDLFGIPRAPFWAPNISKRPQNRSKIDQTACSIVTSFLNRFGCQKWSNNNEKNNTFVCFFLFETRIAISEKRLHKPTNLEHFGLLRHSNFVDKSITNVWKQKWC